MTPEECDEIERNARACPDCYGVVKLAAAWRAERLAKEKAERERDEIRLALDEHDGAHLAALTERDALAAEVVVERRYAMEAESAGKKLLKDREKARAALDLYERGHANWIVSTNPARDRKACGAIGRTDPDHPDCTCGLREARAALRG